MKRLIWIFALCFLLTSCATSQYDNFAGQETIKARFDAVLSKYEHQDKTAWKKFLKGVKTEKQVNDKINSIPYATDQQTYGKADYWASPQEMLKHGAADCEDYALAKYFALRELGYKDSDLKLAVVVIPAKDNIAHAILIVKSVDVLNNRTKKIRSKKSYDKIYRFAYQVNANTVERF